VPVGVIDLLENPARWDGEIVRTRAFALLIGRGSESALKLFAADEAGSREQGVTRCDVSNDPILVPLSREVLSKVRGLSRFDAPRLIELEGLFSTWGTRLYFGYAFFVFDFAIIEADVLTINSDVCHFLKRVE
jgi:hypothetical protein